MRLTALVLIIAIAACGPEPTTPSDKSLAGKWSSTVKIFTFSSIRMEIVQEPQGIVSGTWFLRDDETATDVSGSIIGRNTVAQVEIELQGLGQFEGALVDTNTMRGIFALGEKFESITFVRGTLTP